MSCPCFGPRQPRPSGGAAAQAPLPLGDVWEGVCLAQPDTPVEPAEECVPLCNFGYARGACPRFPADTAADAVRFAIAAGDGHSLEIRYAVERGHLPLDHGEIQYRIAEDAFQPPLGATPFAAQARAYAASYLRRIGEAAGSE